MNSLKLNKKSFKLIIIINCINNIFNNIFFTIVYNNIIGDSTMSSRQIPAKFKIRESMPLTKNSKVDFNALKNEPLDGSEINVDVSETNLTVDHIEIYKDTKKSKIRIKK